MLLQEMTRMVTGPLLLYETAADPSGEALRQAYRFIFAPEAGLVPASAALSIVTSPFWRAQGNEQPDSRLQGLVQQFTLQDKVAGLTSDEDTPAWLTAQQRRLEKTIAMMADEPRTEAEDADQRGRLEALEFTSNLIARLARADAPRKGEAAGARTCRPRSSASRKTTTAAPSASTWSARPGSRTARSSAS
jgi:hypothetical protein